MWLSFYLFVCSLIVLNLFWFHIVSHHRVFVKMQHHIFEKLHSGNMIVDSSYLWKKNLSNQQEG